MRGARSTLFLGATLSLSLVLAVVSMATSCGSDDRPDRPPIVEDTGIVSEGGDADVSEVVEPKTPVQIAREQNHPHSLAIDDKFIYWTNNVEGSINKLPVDAPICTKTGCSTATTIASGEKFPTGIAVDATWVWWVTEGGDVRRAKLAGGPAETVTSGHKYPRAITLDDQFAYFTCDSEGTVKRVDKTTKDVRVIVTIPDMSAGPWGIATYGDFLYFTTFSAAGKIYEVPKNASGIGGDAGPDAAPETGADSGPDDGLDGGADGSADGGGDAGAGLRTLAMSLDTPKHVAADDKWVYFTVNNTGYVMKVARTGPGSTVVLAKSQHLAEGLHLDDNALYWANHYADESIGKVVHATSVVTYVANGQALPRDVAGNAKYLYWANEGAKDFEGSIMRIPK